MPTTQEAASDLPGNKASGGVGQVLGDAWCLARPFWTDERERRAWLLLASVIALTLSAVWLNVQFSQWNNNFYNTLQDHNLPGFWRQLGVFGLLAVAYIVVAVYRQYLQQLLFMRWRMWFPNDLQCRWLQPGVDPFQGSCSDAARTCCAGENRSRPMRCR